MLLFYFFDSYKSIKQTTILVVLICLYQYNKFYILIVKKLFPKGIRLRSRFNYLALSYTSVVLVFLLAYSFLNFAGEMSSSFVCGGDLCLSNNVLRHLLTLDTPLAKFLQNYKLTEKRKLWKYKKELSN